MSDQFVGEIRMFGGTFAPRGWAFCNGQLLSISQNTALFSLLGTQYGGNGTSNFALPNLAGNVPIGQGQGTGLTNRVIGDVGGASSVTLLASEGAAHSHPAMASSAAATGLAPAGALLASTDPTNPIYGVAGQGAEIVPPMGALAIGNSPSAAALPHNNRQPYLAVSFIIAMQGIFPARN